MSRETTVQSRVTESFYACGTPLYMSPEQCMGKQLDTHSDIYSLGCILHEALTGVNVFQGANAMETFARQCQMIAPSLSSTYPEGQFSLPLESCVAKMLAKDAADRPQSMGEVMTLLHAAQWEN